MRRSVLYFFIGTLLLALILFFFLRGSIVNPKPLDQDDKGLSSKLIANTNIIEVVTGEIQHNKNILIEDGRIKKIVPFKKNDKAIKNITTIDGTDLFVIPGLWDMHTHPDDPEVWRMLPTTKEKDLLLPQFVINGVTGIRDMGGDLNLVKRWRKLAESDSLIAPKIIACGPLLDGPNPMWDGSVGIDSPEKVKYIVDSLINEGVDFLKVYSLLPRDTYLVLSDYANQINFPFVGHVPFGVPPSEAAITGMKSQEHLLEILKECTAAPSDSLRNVLSSIDNGINRWCLINEYRIKHFNSKKANTLYNLFKANNIWHCPTLSMWHKNAWYEEELVLDKSHLKYLPKYLQKYWTPKHNDHLKNRDNPEFIHIKQQLYLKYLYIVKNMNEAGVKLLAGTDMGANPLCFPGIGLHNEIKKFVDAGLTPLEALQTATINPAIFLNLEKDYGTVSQGKVADLVLLKSNPLENIDSISTIKFVFKNGKVLNEATIQKIKKDILNKIDTYSNN